MGRIPQITTQINKSFILPSILKWPGWSADLSNRNTSYQRRGIMGYLQSIFILLLSALSCISTLIAFKVTN